jgi:hypothetical protein
MNVSGEVKGTAYELYSVRIPANNGIRYLVVMYLFECRNSLYPYLMLKC